MWAEHVLHFFELFCHLVVWTSIMGLFFDLGVAALFGPHRLRIVIKILLCKADLESFSAGGITDDTQEEYGHTLPSPLRVATLWVVFWLVLAAFYHVDVYAHHSHVVLVTVMQGLAIVCSGTIAMALVQVVDAVGKGLMTYTISNRYITDFVPRYQDVRCTCRAKHARANAMEEPQPLDMHHATREEHDKEVELIVTTSWAEP
eukprot:NODE_13847_length_1143_cov_5.182087.p2 GENE.NODE_13847_length_1143_cov_5.182087~~NODE_13847_length_1143_cov_5.182087.p2  ORF type:complete len:232 (+),score=81.02 NODE_13847_length_1143_cov_5.182087:88-696(+)